ncbi:type I glyceraldehyde-3-phosphate dehydrogenase [Candidatus Pacearchaeota archaeon]|nr:type I glyceraldehyde-3-phosphate dehydrogenase [Candidatus Pacearchaeota archaeon]
MNVAINGLGRIGKLFLQTCVQKNVPWNIVINEMGDPDYVVYTLKHDSVHHGIQEPIHHDGKHLFIGKRKFLTVHETDPLKLPWKKENIDLVVECTGFFTEKEGAEKHLKAGARKVLISAPAKGHDLTLIPGVNNSDFRKEHKIISAGSCTTNCTAPMIKILHEAYNLKSAFFVTTHAYTSTQRLVDGHDKRDLARGRAAAYNIVPTTSGAAISVVESLPQLKGKIEGYALRVPVIDGSITSIVAKVEKKVSAKDVNAVFKRKTSTDYKGIVEYSDDFLVSSDIIGNPHSCIFNSHFTQVIDDTISIAGWYDNEWGYSNRLIDVAQMILESEKVPKKSRK